MGRCLEPAGPVHGVGSVQHSFLVRSLSFNGVLLPKMEGVFGRWDNGSLHGVLFAFYHLHQPWGILRIILVRVCCSLLVGKHFRTNWFPIILHNPGRAFSSYS